MEKSNYILRNSISLEECKLDWESIFNLTKKHIKPSTWYSDTGYGLTHIYKDYAGFDNSYIPKVNTLHGTFMGMNDSWWLNSEAGFKSTPAMFIHYNYLKNKLENLFKNKKKSFYLISHPYHYILDNYKVDTIKNKKGSILFLPHTLGYGKPLNINFLTKVLNELTDDFLPIRICIHPNDFESETVNKLRTLNYEIVSCGGRYDPLFLHRFFWVCNGFNYCLSIDLSTHTILSSLSGLKIISLIDRIPMMNWIHGNYVPPNILPDFEYWDILDEYYSHEINQEKFYNAANEVTGAKYKLSREDLKSIFNKCESDFYYKKMFYNLSCRNWSLFEQILRNLRAYKKAIQNRLSGNNKLLKAISPRFIYELYKYHKSFL